MKKFEITETQLIAIINLTDTISAMLGGGELDEDLKKDVAAVDRFLNKNGYKRKYK